MEPQTKTTATSGTTSQPPDFATPVFEHFARTFNLSGDGLFGIFETIWSIYSIIAYLISFVLLYIFIYASMRLNTLKAAQVEMLAAARQAYLQAYGTAPKQTRWHEIQAHVDSSNPNDWKQAIIEADVMLDDSLKRMGFSGTSLGERLRSMSPQSLSTLDEAWTAHKVRNQIAHGGSDFVLTQKLTRDTMARYKIVFEELGVL